MDKEDTSVYISQANQNHTKDTVVHKGKSFDLHTLLKRESIMISNYL